MLNEEQIILTHNYTHMHIATKQNISWNQNSGGMLIARKIY